MAKLDSDAWYRHMILGEIKQLASHEKTHLLLVFWRRERFAQPDCPHLALAASDGRAVNINLIC